MKLTAQEKIEFDEVYEYLKNDILNYSSDMKLSRKMIFRIYGTAFGELYHNSNKEIPLIYSFKIILATFIFMKDKIRYCLETMRFKDEDHMVNTIFKLIDNNINTIKILSDRKIEQDKIEEKKDLSYMEREVQPYKSKDKFKDKFKEFM